MLLIFGFGFKWRFPPCKREKYSVKFRSGNDLPHGILNAFSTSGLTKYALRILRKTWGREQFVYIFKLSTADQLCNITLAEQRFQKRDTAADFIKT